MSEFQVSAEFDNEILKCENRLRSLGLSLSDLHKLDLVLDIGADDCLVQRLAKQLGKDNVISVDRKFSESIKNSELNVLVNDASNLDVEDDKVDMALVQSSAYYYTKSPDESSKILHEINRVLKDTGEQRVYPPRFGHIVSQLLKDNSDFYDAKSVAPAQRSMAQVSLISQYESQANVLTEEFLRNSGIEFEKRVAQVTNETQNLEEYIIIPKFKHAN